MGIKGLAKLIGDAAPQAVKDVRFEQYFGRKVAIDASMHIYQFMAVVGRTGDQVLTNEAGEITAHLTGMFYRTLRMLEAGIKPLYVFDGKAPELKSGELAKRREKRAEAEAELANAKEQGDDEAIERYAKRNLRVTREHNEECKRLLRLMGVPVIDAPSEAEAQCAEFVRQGLVYAAATEDMDCLTFGTPLLCRHMMAPASKDAAVVEISQPEVLSGLGLTQAEFVDLCILCGCDYCPTIPKLGPKTALNLIKEHRSIDEILRHLDRDRYPVPEDFPYAEARRLFLEPDVQREGLGEVLKWGAPDEEGLVAFLVNEKSFQEERVRKGVQRIRESKGKAAQGRLESFFGPVTVTKKAAKEGEGKGKKGAGAKAAPKKGGVIGGVGGKKKAK